MERYRAYLLPGVAALIVLAYYAWRWTSGSAPEPPAPAASTDAKTPAPAGDAKPADGGR